MRRLETNQRKQTRSCDVDSTFRCDDVNCNRRKLCSRVELAKRRMIGHDRKTKAARRFAWGADYNSYRNRITQGVLILVLSTLFATTARTHDYKRPSLDQWYGSLQRPHMSPHGGGASCCSKEDCHTTEAELRNGEWWARLGKPIDQAGQRDWELEDWVRIPDEIIVRGPNGNPVTNEAGEAVICHPTVWKNRELDAAHTTVFCFVPPDQS